MITSKNKKFKYQKTTLKKCPKSHKIELKIQKKKNTNTYLTKFIFNKPIFYYLFYMYISR